MVTWHYCMQKHDCKHSCVPGSDCVAKRGSTWKVSYRSYAFPTYRLTVTTKKTHFASLCTSWGMTLILLQDKSSSCRVETRQRETGNWWRSLSERDRETRRWKMARSLIQPTVRGWPRMAVSVCSNFSWLKLVRERKIHTVEGMKIN